MSFDIALTPAGHLHLRENETEVSPIQDGWTRRVCEGFSVGQAAGLFALGATRPSIPPSPSLAFWREFSCDYLTQLCRIPEFTGNKLDSIEPLSPARIASLLLSVPPMQGGEYLNAEILENLRRELDQWVRNEVTSSGLGLTDWIKEHAPLWHQVGRVCFHLAENKRDPQYPFAFLATYAPRLSQGGRVQYQPLGKALLEYAGEQNKKALINLLSPIQRAAEQSGLVKELVESGEVFASQAWTPAEAYRLLKDVPLLEESGLLVRLPDWWHKRPRPRVAVTIGEKKLNRFGADAMLDFKVDLALGDQRLSQEEWQELLQSGEKLVFLKGQWVEVDRERLSEAMAHWKQLETQAAEGGISFIEGMRLLAGAPADLNANDQTQVADREWAFIHAGSGLEEILSFLRDPGKLSDGQSDKGKGKDFHATLRPYQETGCKWLRFLSSLGLGACLADDMGLGKTLQVLCLLSEIKESNPAGPEPHGQRKPSLLVLPASLLANWKSEMRRFTPTLSTRFVHPSECDPDQLAAMIKDPARAFSTTDLVLTTFGMLHRHKWLGELPWHLVILDEAQAIKNPSSRQTQAVKKLRADARIALTGTPVENRLGDLWSIFDFLCPGLLGSATRFKEFVKGLEGRPHDRYAPLRNLVQPYILRRLKTDKRIIADLPDKTEVKAYCGLSTHQAALYARSVRELSDAIETTEGIRRRGLVLSYLLRFKQICNHPSQLLGDGRYDPADSGKFDRLRTLCEEIASRQEKVLVFTQFREMTEPIASFLTPIFGRSGLILHGGTAVKNRRSLVESFQSEEGPPFFVLSLKAGGTGLNLTAASHVIHFDRWWNPAVENQATDRAFRIGQHRNVLVHKFICRGTLEEKIDGLIEDKIQMAEGLLNAKAGTDGLLMQMSNEELLKVVSLDLDQTQLS